MKNQQLFVVITLLILTCLFSSCDNKKIVTDNYIKQVDSVSVLIELSKNKSFSAEKKKEVLYKSYELLKTLPKDTINSQKLSLIAYRFYTLKDTSTFLKINKEVIKLATKLKDSFTIADAHWSYADYFTKNEKYDNAYYHFNEAYKYFIKIDRTFEAARVLSQMAFIKGRYRDYTGSEALYVEVIKLFKKINHNRYLHYSYCGLASLQIDIKKYDKALEYYDTALGFLKKVENNEKYLADSFNDIGFTYLEKGEYLEAIKHFNKALEYTNNVRSYGRIIDNRAYSRLLLGDTLNVEKDLLRSLQIRDSLNIKAGIGFSKYRLSKFYSFIKDNTKAIEYAKQSNLMAKEVKNGVDYLKSLKLLASLDKNNSNKYLEEYIRYNDSLIDSERKYINKFSLVEFETDEIVKTNEVLTKQRIWIFACSIGAILILSLLYLVRVQRAKNEKLFLETEQQKANEQVYLLTLKQQATLEEEKTRERNRISQELHDGILGRLFGTRVGMGFLDIGTDEETQKQHQAFLDELQEIEKEIREVSHKLNTNFEDPDVNFTTIINQLLESKSQIGDFRFHLDIDQNISWKSTDEIIKVNVYRIIQEALQNTIKHANAQNVTLDFSSDSNQLTIRLKDDGKGFSMKKSKKGIGLKNIRSRVQKMNGTIDIVSAIGKGTEIHIKIPISQ